MPGPNSLRKKRFVCYFGISEKFLFRGSKSVLERYPSLRWNDSVLSSHARNETAPYRDSVANVEPPTIPSARICSTDSNGLAAAFNPVVRLLVVWQALLVQSAKAGLPRKTEDGHPSAHTAAEGPPSGNPARSLRCRSHAAARPIREATPRCAAARTFCLRAPGQAAYSRSDAGSQKYAGGNRVQCRENTASPFVKKFEKLRQTSMSFDFSVEIDETPVLKLGQANKWPIVAFCLNRIKPVRQNHVAFRDRTPPSALIGGLLDGEGISASDSGVQLVTASES